MKREEQIISEAKKYYYDDINCHNAFLHGVEWADENPANIWHDASEEPQKGYFLIEFGENKYDTLLLRHCLEEGVWEICCREKKITRWANIADLLPKGGEK